MKLYHATYKQDGETIARVVRAENVDEAMLVVWNNGGSASVMVREAPHEASEIPDNMKLGWQ